MVGSTIPRALPVALPPANTPRGSTSIDFGENQLSPGLIGLSPLPTSHPNGFQPIPVRASTGCYPSFTLRMDRSPWLRVYPQALSSPSAGLAFALAPRLSRLASRLRRNSPDHNAKGTPSAVTPLARRPASDRLSACGFRLSFTPRTGVLFTCPSRYSSTIGHTGVFSLGGWSPQLPAGLLAPRGTQDPHYARPLAFGYRALTVSGAASQPTSPGFVVRVRGSYNPARHVGRFGLDPFRSPLLRASRLISLPAGTEMFQFPAFASPCGDDRTRARPGFPIRPSEAHRLCAPPLGLSQLTTAFIASVCPGIPHMPSLA